jgi:hypothetical protein
MSATLSAKVRTITGQFGNSVEFSRGLLEFSLGPQRMTEPPPHPPAPTARKQTTSFSRRGLLLVCLFTLIAAALVWWVNWTPQVALTGGVGSGSAISAEALAAIPNAAFSEITANSGVGFVHYNGAEGEKLLPETMGGGVAFFDCDSDGDQDLLFINSCRWPWSAPSDDPPPTMGLFLNDGRGHFADITRGSGLDVSFYGMGVAVGDFDRDGLPDVLITGVGGNRLFQNLGQNKFAEITAAAGVGGSTNDWSTSAAWLDYDNDGDLDLFVCRYVRWSRPIDLEAGYKLDGVTRAYGPPMNFKGAFPALYRNEGSGHFTDVSTSSGIQVTNPVTGEPMAKALAVAPVDADNDGWIDLVVANDTVQNFLFRNLKNGRFQEIGSRSGIAFDAYGMTRGAMGIDAARFRNDDALGVAIGNFANEMNALYVSQRDALVFADEAITEGVGPASKALLKFGLFFDYDLDGRLDVLTANGHLDEAIQKFQTSQRYRQPAQLFWNSGSSQGNSFVPVPPEKCGKDIFKPIVGRGSAFADIDNDGDLDVVLTQIAGPPLLLRNDQELNHHWLRLKLIGTKNNRDAIGAWVKVRVGNQTLSRQVMPSKSYLSQSELPVTFGLGFAERLDEVSIVWPGGNVQKLSGLRLDALNVVAER